MTVTAIDTISKAGKETATRAGPTSFQTSVLLDGSSCQDCSIVYGVELQADNEFGTSSLVRPTVVHSKSSGTCITVKTCHVFINNQFIN